MITLTSLQLNGWLALMLWPFARILALLATAPLTGSPQVPAAVKIGLAIFDHCGDRTHADDPGH